MVHDPANVLAAQSHSDTKLRGLLGGMSVFTMIMTVPQEELVPERLWVCQDENANSGQLGLLCARSERPRNR